MCLPARPPALLTTGFSIAVVVLLTSCDSPQIIKKNERYYNAIFCRAVGGKSEVRHPYSGRRYISVDCETDTTVYEAGLDARSSLDSLQQAVFASTLTQKKPAIVIYDRDQRLGRYELRIKTAAEAVGVEFIRYPVNHLE